jgi:endonuclease/exonuclease/phosphatase family metal-dependent hydrolase
VHLRVLTYNVHKCIGGVDRRYDPLRVRDAVAACRADVLLLQEVDEGARRTRGDRQVDVLGDLLGLRHRAYFPNVRLRGGGHYGNAVLSRHAIVDVVNVDVTIPPTKPRSILQARLRVRHGGRNRTVVVCSLHLGLLGFLRARQVRRFLQADAFASLHPRAPSILAGDFNDSRGRLGELLRPAGFREAPRAFRTFPAVAPMRALDRMYVRGDAAFAGVERVEGPAARWASDHRPVVADVRLD